MPTVTAQVKTEEQLEVSLCIFCGGEELELVEHDFEEWGVVCETCKTCGPSAATPETAVNGWNRPVRTEHAD